MQLQRLLPLVSILGAGSVFAQTNTPLLGFSEQGATEQRSLEKRFDSTIKAGNFSEWMKWMSSKPHHVGSPFGKEVAEFIAAKFKEWGYQTEIERFEVLFPTPQTRILELIGPGKFKAALQEPKLREDTTSGITKDQLPTFNAYSCDGDVTGELVYVNFGLPDDYDELARRGIDVKGKIVIARYGASWRGVKPKVAAEKGAIGCIIYSDPEGDGYARGDAYPKGPWRPEQGAQRGSVADLPQFPGDPLTPNAGATPQAKRLQLQEAPTITKIPVLPISHGDALPFLKALEGPVAPSTWQGRLPITYHFGLGPAKVRLKLKFDWRQTPAFDVIARMPGSEFPDEWVLRGNHHDAWVFGANDPLSGTVTLMEEARVIGELAKSGWKPKRTLIFAAWDGEEPGLLGSTEWAEAHATELKRHAVAYVNGDLNTRGFLAAGGSHILQRLVNQAAAEVEDPETRRTVRERWRAFQLLRGSAEQRQFARANHDLLISPLGSGSDYTPFLQHLGIPSLDLRFNDGEWEGAYHSIYDSFDHYSRFVNPGFVYNTTLAQVSGRVLLRLAQAEILPFEFTGFAERANAYTRELRDLARQARGEVEQINFEIQERLGSLLARPGQTYHPPQLQELPPRFDFAPLTNSAAKLTETASRLQRRLDGTKAQIALERRRTINGLLRTAEQALTDEAGLPGRPWFKHMIYAPGAYTGYAVKTLPTVREALERRQWKDVDPNIVRTAKALDRLNQVLLEVEKALPAN